MLSCSGVQKQQHGDAQESLWSQILRHISPNRVLIFEVVNSIHVPKGTPVVVPIQAIGCSKEIWGPDAKEFKPERWLDETEEMRVGGPITAEQQCSLIVCSV